MKTKVFIFFALVFAAVSCNYEESHPVGKTPAADQNQPVAYNEAYAAMQQLIGQGYGYDIMNVEKLIAGKEGYWQLDAVLGYDSDFKNVMSVYRDFDAAAGQDYEEPIFAFGGQNIIFCYDISPDDGRIAEQAGTWSFDPRTLKLAVSVPGFSGNETVESEFTLLSLSEEAIVLEWTADGGEAMRASLRPASLNCMKVKGINIAVDKFMTECSGFSSEDMERGLPGGWVMDSYLVYDENWQKVVKPYMVMGESYAEGTSYFSYAFADDGTGMVYLKHNDPSESPEAFGFDWSYDSEKNELILSGEQFNVNYAVSGYCGEYVVLDNVSMDENIRLIFRRKTE